MSAVCMPPAALSSLHLLTCQCVCPVCSLRALYGTDGTMNATHGSDSRASASREIRFHFPKLTQVCLGKSGRLHTDAMLHVTQPVTQVAMVMLVGAMKVGTLRSPVIQIWRHLAAALLWAAASAVQLRACHSRSQGSCSSEQLTLNHGPACSKSRFLPAGLSAGRTGCLAVHHRTADVSAEQLHLQRSSARALLSSLQKTLPSSADFWSHACSPGNAWHLQLHPKLSSCRTLYGMQQQPQWQQPQCQASVLADQGSPQPSLMGL